MPNARQRQRKSERDHLWSEDDTFSHVFAEVVAFYDRCGMLHPADERESAEEITKSLHEMVRTGLTDNQRLMAIQGAVCYALDETAER
jgi:hypothetical protein